MSLGTLDFRLPRPDFLNFGRSIATELSVEVVLPALVGHVVLQTRAALQIDAVLPGLSGLAIFASPNQLRIAVTLPSLSGQGIFAQYFLPPRGPARRIEPTSSHPLSINILHQNTWNSGARTVNSPLTLWNDARAVAKRVEDVYIDPEITPTSIHTFWNDGHAVREGVTPVADNGIVIEHEVLTWWNEGQKVRHAVHDEHDFPIITPICILSPWNEGLLLRTRQVTTYQEGLITEVAGLTWWNDGRWPFPGDRYPRPDPDEQPRSLTRGRLDFRCFAPHLLAFGSTCFGMQGLLVAVRRSYRVINSASMKRRVDNLDIPVSSLSVKIDWDSWCWSLSATVMTKEAADLIRAKGTEVTVTINGFVWGFVIDDVSQDRAFNAFSANVSGRSLVAGLSEPYSTSRSYRETQLKTAAQLCLQELPLIGNYFIDFEIPDWTIPANTYQYEGLTPIKSILRIVKASGGKVQAAMNSLLLTCSPRWTQKPWAWNFTPAATLPASYVTKEQLTSKVGFEYEAAIVSGGVNGGIIGKVKRMNTAGDSLASTVVDTLIVDILPATGRGLQEIADLWPVKQYQVTLPLQAQPEGAGLLLPGLTFDFDEGDDGWRGMVTGTSITVGMNDVVQTLEVVSV